MSLKKRILNCIFAAARDAGVSSELLRDTIAPGVIGKRLSQASVPELQTVAKHMTTRVKLKPNSNAVGNGNKKAVEFHKRFEDLAGRDGMATPKQLRMIEAMWKTGANIKYKTDAGLRNFINKNFKTLWPRSITADEVSKIKRAIEAINAVSGPN